MKIVSNVLEDIEGIQMFYVLGLVIFLSFFIGVLIRTYKMSKTEADHIRYSILEEDDENYIEKDAGM